MTRAEILAATDAETIRLTNAAADVALYTEQERTAGRNRADAETTRAAAQARLTELAAMLAALTGEFDPTADHHAPGDRHGMRVIGQPTHTVFVDPFETRSGHPARTIHTFGGKQPLETGQWERLAEALESFPDRQHLAAWNTGDGANARGKQATPAQIAAGATRLRQSIATDAPRLRRMWLNRIALGHVDQIIDRPNHECNGYPFDWAFGIAPLPKIPAAEARRLSALMADAYREWFEFILEIAADVYGSRFAQTRWAFNLAGGGTGREGAADLVRRAWPRRQPPGTRMVLTVDHYFKDPGSATHLAKVIDVVDELAAELPGVVAIGIDETGGHLGAAAHPAQLAALRATEREYGQILASWIASDRRISHLAWFEKDDPGRDTDGVFCQVWTPSEHVGPLTGTAAGADGPFRSNYPQIAGPFVNR